MVGRPVEWKVEGPHARLAVRSAVVDICALNEKIAKTPGLLEQTSPKMLNARLTPSLYCECGGKSAVLRIRFLTPMLQWVDIIRLEITNNRHVTGSNEQLKIIARGNSRGCCPSSCPGAPLGSILCCCLPFKDHGSNFTRLQLLKQKLEQAGLTVTEEATLMKGDYSGDGNVGAAPQQSMMARNEDGDPV